MEFQKYVVKNYKLEQNAEQKYLFYSFVEYLKIKNFINGKNIHPEKNNIGHNISEGKNSSNRGKRNSFQIGRKAEIPQNSPFIFHAMEEISF